MKQRAREWLANGSLPLWNRKGVDWQDGGFVENLSIEGEPMDGFKRSMVQARQIYTYRTAVDLGVIEPKAGAELVTRAAEFGLKHYALPSGAFAHSVTQRGALLVQEPDLYAQAFALFGLANAYAVERRAEYREAAQNLLGYLRRERRVPRGGYTEIKGGKTTYESNPHMHLFEAALAWIEVDPGEPRWRDLADEVLNLCRTKFIDSATGLLCEQFTAEWAPIRIDGRFVFEPGHQYEWAWLMGRYQKLTGVDLLSLRQKLFELSEAHGISAKRKTAHDQVWSDFIPKLESSRFWPQCERIKCAVQLGAPGYAAADEALVVLFRYFDAPVYGTWFDTWAADGTWIKQPVKSSSLYHIIGALSEYIKLR